MQPGISTMQDLTTSAYATRLSEKYTMNTDNWNFMALIQIFMNKTSPRVSIANVHLLYWQDCRLLMIITHFK